MASRTVQRKEAEITKAGRLFFDAVFGDDGDFEKTLSEDAPDEREGAITVEGHALVACDGCGRGERESDPRELARRGWRLDARGWSCPACSSR